MTNPWVVAPYLVGSPWTPRELSPPTRELSHPAHGPPMGNGWTTPDEPVGNPWATHSLSLPTRGGPMAILWATHGHLMGNP